MLGQERFKMGRTESEGISGTQINITIPARFGLLPILGAAIREYCAALPHNVVGRMDLSSPTRFLTGQLKFTDGQPVVVGYSHFVYSAELILQEAASNIIRHGYKGEFLSKNIYLELSAVKIFDTRANSERLAFQMELSDDAPPFNPTTAKWREPDPLEPRESGYGIYLIRRLTDGVSYRYENGRNFLRMYKFIEIAG